MTGALDPAPVHNWPYAASRVPASVTMGTNDCPLARTMKFEA